MSITKKLENKIMDLAAEVESLRAERDALLADKRRLDYCNRNFIGVDFANPDAGIVGLIELGKEVNFGIGFSANIDNAMKLEAEPAGRRIIGYQPDALKAEGVVIPPPKKP